MKSLLLPLLAALALPTAVNAQTWIYITGSYGEDGGWYERFIDVSSIVKNGHWRYANMKFTGPWGEHIDGIKVNCKTLIFSYNFIKITRRNENYWVDSIGKKSTFNDEAEGSFNLLCKEWQFK